MKIRVIIYAFAGVNGLFVRNKPFHLLLVGYVANGSFAQISFALRRFLCKDMRGIGMSALYLAAFCGFETLFSAAVSFDFWHNLFLRFI